MPIPPVSSRDQKLERVLNALIEAVNAAEQAGVLSIAGGSGVLTGSINGRPRTGLSLPEARDEIRCRIVSQDGGGSPDDPANITYAIEAVDEDWGRAGVKPLWNRPSKDGVWKIYPCAVGDICWWIRVRNDLGEVDPDLSGLFVCSETIAEGPCGGA